MNKLRSIIRQAIDNLSPRQKYAADVIRGKQLWSGADLQGKARKYGGGYARQRDKARDALDDAGGIVIPVEHGRLETAAPRGRQNPPGGTPITAPRSSPHARA